jgi:hypothetical protein
LAALCRESRSINRVDGNIGSDTGSVANLFAVVQPRRFVLFALTNDDNAVHLHGIECLAHGIDRYAVSGVFVPASHKSGRRQSTCFCHSNEIECKIAVR